MADGFCHISPQVLDLRIIKEHWHSGFFGVPVLTINFRTGRGHIYKG